MHRLHRMSSTEEMTERNSTSTSVQPIRVREVTLFGTRKWLRWLFSMLTDCGALACTSSFGESTTLEKTARSGRRENIDIREARATEPPAEEEWSPPAGAFALPAASPDAAADLAAASSLSSSSSLVSSIVGCVAESL